MNTRRCEQCGEHLPARHAHNARFCSGRCRTAAHRASRAVPKELLERPRWVRRTARKVPLTAGGRPASSTDRGTWSTYREAARSSAGTGLGFVLDGDGVVCVDLDHALDEQGRALPWARRVLDAAPGCWVEVSVSGRGLHLWGRGHLESGRRLVVDGGSVELYGNGRYIAVTGVSFDSSPKRLGDIQPLIDAVLS
ncbi:DNA primase [Streptomyces sp. NPDC049887]|uniref:DNA primase n=1 Tax=Streptomyces sp. NPDC049887 TaxID=3155654 RepID=UPI003447E8E6